eukprot:3206154-Pyramimonas_sp.AAC.1
MTPRGSVNLERSGLSESADRSISTCLEPLTEYSFERPRCSRHRVDTPRTCPERVERSGSPRPEQLSSHRG